jgi:L-lactate dehydrogenase complex protein LldF
MLHPTAATFRENATAALQDQQLRGALRTLVNVIGGRRRDAVTAATEWDTWRDRARAIKDDTLEHLDAYLARFEENATRAGATVHWARDASEANALIIGLLRTLHATHVVKSKSMATEEIHLNAALEQEGVEVVESDLGEWIIQLAGETPSHIVVPAIHKSKQQIADLFVEKLGIARTDDVGALTRAARTFLRERFAAAEVGISGVNFGIAETGSILVLENEGNARLSTSLPRVHIAVMGIEKVIPRLADLDVFLKLLPRSGTGQQLTTYQSLITGTRRTADGEGPEQVHIVLLDAGRSRLLGAPLTRQTLACIRCGACLNVCPVYQQIGGHAYGTVYPGPIGSVLMPQLSGLEGANALPYASSLCGACRDVCPVRIDIPSLLLQLRAEVVEGTSRGTADQHGPAKKARLEKLAFRMFGWGASRAWVFETAARFLRVGQRLVARGGRIAKVRRPLTWVAPPLAAWTAERDLRTLAPRSFHELWRDGERQPAASSGGPHGGTAPTGQGQ